MLILSKKMEDMCLSPEHLRLKLKEPEIRMHLRKAKVKPLGFQLLEDMVSSLWNQGIWKCPFLKGDVSANGGLGSKA